MDNKRPGETDKEYADRLLATLTDVRREAQRAILRADLEARRAIESERQKVSFIQLLQEELQQQRDQNDGAAQALPAYLAQVSRLQTHAIRLLPLPPSLRRQQQQHHQSQGPQGLQGSIPLHVQRSSASGGRAVARPTSTSSQPTTSGRTDIVKKYYPLRLRPWVEFPAEVQQNCFARIYGALAQQHPAQYGLPSRLLVQKDEDALLEDLPLLALNQQGGLNAARTHGFLKAVLLTPASRILNEYLKIAEPGDGGAAAGKKIFFDTAVQSVETVMHSVRSVGSFENAENADNLQSIQSASRNQPRKVLPDCLVLCMDSDPSAETQVQLVASAEHKPLHAIRAASVSQIINGPLSEDLIVRLAREASARRDRATAKQLQAAERGQASAPVPESEPRSTVHATSKTGKIDKLTYFAYALTQAYHYMLLSGVEFGFMATGEVIVFLRIPEDDATTLYYHASLFPASRRAPGEDDDDGDAQTQTDLPRDVTHAPFPAPGDPVSEEELAKLPIAQMVSFCEYARHTERRSSAWAVDQIARLARFPDLPLGVAAQYDQVPPSRLRRRRRDDDDNNSDGDDNNGSNDGSGHSHRQPHVPSQHGSHIRSTSPTRQDPNPGPGDEATEQDISTTFLFTTYDLHTRPRPSHKVEPPTLPYCTHSCLLGLVHRGPLDPRCPNVDLHRAAGRRQDEDAYARHPLSSFELAQRIRDQLYDTPEVDCEYSRSSRGAIGYPFKLTLTGFGYTFIGKGVREEYGRRLVRESEIYKGLLPLQGSVIPVHLGLIQLHVGYPVLSDFLQLPYMMLLSYAGESMAGSLLQEDNEQDEAVKLKDEAVVHYRVEAARTERELKSWGLDDEDDNASNFRWCAEAGRAMRIDFDRAYLVVPLQRRSRPLRLSTNTHVSIASHVSQTSQQSASSHNTPTTPTRGLDEATSPDLHLPLPMAGNQKASDRPLSKRQKLDGNDCDI